MKPYDFVAIGGGSAGYNAARIAVGLGMRVALPALFMLGFLSGWVSFDYLAHVCFVAVPVWLLNADLKKHTRTMLFCIAASSVGFMRTKPIR